MIGLYEWSVHYQVDGAGYPDTVNLVMTRVEFNAWLANLLSDYTVAYLLFHEGVCVGVERA